MLSVLLISGPTASGKSALAIQCADALNGEVINIDSVQMYRDASIGSAKPEDTSHIPHHCFDEFNPDETLDAVQGGERVALHARGVIARHKVPIVVGSPGLHLSTAYGGISLLPSRNDEMRARIRALSSDERWNLLVEGDGARALELHPHDTQRVERSLEILLSTGKTFSALRSDAARLPPILGGIIIVLWPDRHALYEQIALRAQRMVNRGLIEETQSLITRFGVHAPLLKAVGYKEAIEVLRGVVKKEKLVENIALATRHYAKRQCTYWRNEPQKRNWQQRIVGAHGSLVPFPSLELSQAHMPRSRYFDECVNTTAVVAEVSLLSEMYREHRSRVGSNTEVWYVKTA
jgi:tRNA dimethylallyltransferase